MGKHLQAVTHYNILALTLTLRLTLTLTLTLILSTSLVPSHLSSTRSVGLVSKLLYSKWRTVKLGERPNSLAPSPAAPLVKPKRLTGDEAN